MPGHGLNRSFWTGRKVFVTGHTGFMGGWLTLQLARLGARVSGYALPPPTRPNLFTAALSGQDFNVSNMAGGLEAWSGELQASNVPPLTVEVSAINERLPGS